MPETFDAYHKWLGIPPAEQPPNYYRLLAIPLFESDADVIANAADKQMAHIRSFQTGQHSALSQKILNEIAAARVCLLNAAKKPAYDAVLRRETGGMLPKAASIGAQPAPGFDLESIASPAIARRPQPPRRKKVSWQPLAAIGASVVLLVVIVVFATTRDGRDKAAGPKTSAQLVVKKTPEAAKPTKKPKEKPAKPEPEPEPKQIAPSKSVEPASKPEHIDARPEDKAPAPGPVTEPEAGGQAHGNSRRRIAGKGGIAIEAGPCRCQDPGGIPDCRPGQSEGIRAGRLGRSNRSCQEDGHNGSSGCPKGPRRLAGGRCGEVSYYRQKGCRAVTREVYGECSHPTDFCQRFSRAAWSILPRR